MLKSPYNSSRYLIENSSTPFVDDDEFDFIPEKFSTFNGIISQQSQTISESKFSTECCENENVKNFDSIRILCEEKIENENFTRPKG